MCRNPKNHFGVFHPEKYFMALGKYAYEPYRSGNDVFVRVAHRGVPVFRSVIKVVETKAGYSYELISSTMPDECVAEFMVTLQRNTAFLIKWGLET